MKLFKIIIKLFVLSIVGFVLFNLLAFSYAKLTPKLSIKGANSFYLYDKDKSLFFQGNGSMEWISLGKISPYLINATVAVEDKNFFRHKGFDYFRILKASYINIKRGKIVQGASTISQQYVKNLFLDFDKTWKRKIDEMWLTFELETHYSKKEILEGYLNTINYGHGVYGIENAARFYFNKSAQNLNLAEASMLAGIPKYPSLYSPLVDEFEAKKRQNMILTMMVKNKYISKNEKNIALNEELVYFGKKEKLNLLTVMYYQDAVVKELKEIKSIPASFIKTGGLKIYTNFDINAQTALENAIKINLNNNIDIQVASVVMKPDSGKILGLTGGRDFNVSAYNRATLSKRQVGSTMKPFLYYAALENGFTASTTFLSEPTTFTFNKDKEYTPANYANTYPNKPISMAIALAYSDNVYAVKTHLFLGPDALVDISHRVGITSQLDAVPSLALGTSEINLINLVGGYSSFANEGKKITPYLIERIEDINGKVLFQHKSTNEIVLNKSITFILNELLTNTYDANLIDYYYPSCVGIAPKLTKKYAIKSGTTDTDILTIGYNKEIIVGVWNGYDNNKYLDKADYGFAKNIWADTIENYLKGSADSWYDTPDNVVGVLVDPITGKLADENSKKKKILYYIKGTEPSTNQEKLDNVSN
jgi:penicillin-binding protein 2D